jgi:hypothetical protein
MWNRGKKCADYLNTWLTAVKWNAGQLSNASELNNTRLKKKNSFSLILHSLYPLSLLWSHLNSLFSLTFAFTYKSLILSMVRLPLVGHDLLLVTRRHTTLRRTHLQDSFARRKGLYLTPTTHSRDINPCHRRHSNPQSPISSRRIPTH